MFVGVQLSTPGRGKLSDLIGNKFYNCMWWFFPRMCRCYRCTILRGSSEFPYILTSKQISVVSVIHIIPPKHSRFTNPSDSRETWCVCRTKCRTKQSDKYLLLKTQFHQTSFFGDLFPAFTAFVGHLRRTSSSPVFDYHVQLSWDTGAKRCFLPG